MNANLDLKPVEDLSELGQRTLRRLLRVWFDFERQLARIPIIQRLETGTFSSDDYRRLLLNLRPQVVEGSRWITRAASSFDSAFSDVRSLIIRHAVEEHRDYEMIERDFVAAGGELQAIQARAKNPGSEALHAYLMHEGSQPNPAQMLGAMWIIEGLGSKMAREWAARVEAATGRAGHTAFLRYHAANDGDHMERFYRLMDRVCTAPDTAERIVMTARVVAKLYALQLSEVDEAEE